MTHRGPLTTRPVRAAVIGAGLMGRWHAQAIEGAGARVVLIVDPDRERASRLLARHPGAEVADSIDAVAHGTLDTVHVCTPPGTHDALVHGAARHGAHAIVEKPLTETAAKTRALFETMERAGLLLCPVHQVLFQRGVRQTFARIPDLRATQVTITVASAGARRHDSQAQDELIAEILPNPLAFAHRWLTPTSWSQRWQVVHERAGELRAWRGGLPDVTVQVSSHARPPVNEVHIAGIGGSVHIDLFHGFATFEAPDVSRVRKATRPLTLGLSTAVDAGVHLIRRALRREFAYPGLWELVREFYASLTSGGPPPISPEETIAVADSRDAILQAMGMTSR